MQASFPTLGEHHSVEPRDVRRSHGGADHGTDPAAMERGLGDPEGRNIEGGPEVKGKKLSRLSVEEDLYWGVMKYWYKDLQLYRPAAE